MEKSFKETRVRNLTQLYYSRPEIQKALFEFAKNREISPRYFEGFGKRPDSFEYIGDVFELVKKGATSFHCSEEIWKNPLDISTDLNEQELDEIRIGWDFLLDIDSKYIDYSKIMAQQICNFLKFHGVTNVGLKFSGSKGFHLIIPWKAFPKEINGVKTSDKFPEWPRILLNYISEKINPNLTKEITQISMGPGAKYVRDYEASKEVIPDLILVSPRHLFRMPYSLHEKTALASIVLTAQELEKFDLKDADPMKLSPEKIKEFTPDSREGEATELLTQALDWAKQNEIDSPEENKKVSGKYANFKKIELKNVSDAQLPPCIQKLMQGIVDGKKRGLFALLNLFRSIGMEKELLEKKIEEWNKKNNPPLKKGYIKSQLEWSYRRKPIMPPNCKEFYQGIACCQPDNLCTKIKNPVNYVMRKNWAVNNSGRPSAYSKSKSFGTKKFKNKKPKVPKKKTSKKKLSGRD
ncbi:hypothetical protein HN832_02680 [archaeon]|jgi:hypothetical protein|nr:hypothetical protein [archaeon]MBT4373260.1 hypothetical protein [archaeon]MBT4531605.1 hypothetical protein [archaeon]MBT7001217.1 hypothetical protein [archaeon]MBT7282297.1 hypothetical protein [archaeon]